METDQSPLTQNGIVSGRMDQKSRRAQRTGSKFKDTPTIGQMHRMIGLRIDDYEEDESKRME